MIFIPQDQIPNTLLHSIWFWAFDYTALDPFVCFTNRRRTTFWFQLRMSVCPIISGYQPTGSKYQPIWLKIWWLTAQGLTLLKMGRIGIDIAPIYDLDYYNIYYIAPSIYT